MLRTKFKIQKKNKDLGEKSLGGRRGKNELENCERNRKAPPGDDARDADLAPFRDEDEIPNVSDEDEDEDDDDDSLSFGRSTMR